MNKMKRPSPVKLLFLILCVAFAAASMGAVLPACSAQPDMTAFKGIKWGAGAETTKGLVLLAEEGDFKFLTDPVGQSTAEGVAVDKVVYGFHKNRFYSVIVYFTAEAAFPGLKDALTKHYGEPVQPDPAARKFFWNLNIINILLSYDDASRSGKASYFYKPVQTEAELSQETPAPKN